MAHKKGMNPKIKAEWVACLRDNSYKQGKYLLQDLDNHFDAVGVLVDRAVQAGVLPAPRRFDDKDGVFHGYVYQDNGHTQATRCPKEVWEWAGIGYWTCNHIQTKNDKGMTFVQIADWIDENL